MLVKLIYINGQKLKEVRNTKFLGVILDNELAWSCHIHELNKQLRSAAALLSKVRYWIPKARYLKIYYALFKSHLTYGISVWVGVSDFLVTVLELDPEGAKNLEPNFTQENILSHSSLSTIYLQLYFVSLFLYC